MKIMQVQVKNQVKKKKNRKRKRVHKGRLKENKNN